MPRNRFSKKKKSTSDVYGKQNRLLHGIFSSLGYPYNDERGYWLPILSDILEKRVSGLSGLTLGERDRIIREFSKRYPEAAIHAPWVPYNMRAWKKGNADIDEGSGRQLYVLREAIKEAAPDLPDRERRLRGLCQKHGGVDRPEWCFDVRVLKQILTAFRRIEEKELSARSVG